MVFRLALLVFGVFAGSTAALLIKTCSWGPATIAASRLLGASLVLAPFYVADRRRSAKEPIMMSLRHSVVPAILLALHFISWNKGVTMTLVANASLIVNMTPIAMPFMIIAATHERPSIAEITGTGMAVAGMLLLAFSDYRISVESFKGDLVCFASMLAFAAYLVLAKRVRERTSLLQYIVPLYSIAGIICLVAAIPEVRGGLSLETKNILCAAGLVFIPTIAGHTILNYSMRTMRGQVVAIVNLGQFVSGGILAFALLHERPSKEFLPASLLLCAGAAIAILAGRGKPANR